MNTIRSLMMSISMLVALITGPVTALAAVDTTPPTTSASLTGTKGGDGWYTTAVTVALAAADGADGSGVARTEYSLDNVTWQTYATPLVFDKDGAQSLYFRSTDLAGNIESPARSQEIKVNQAGLVGWWKMDGDWQDASVVGNNGTPFNGATFSANAQVGTQTGSFDGANDYVAIQDNPSLQFGTGNFSVECWIRVDDTLSTNTEYGIINKNATYQRSPGWGMEISSWGAAPHTFSVLMYVSSQNSWDNTLAVTTGINTNSWHHLAGVRQGNSLKVYVNGELKATKTHSDAALSVDNAVQLILGKHSWGSYFPGLIDEVAIYNHALTDIEIQQHYSNNLINRPTVNPVSSSTASATITLSGIKQANTAIVVNNTTLVPLDAMTSWNTSFTLSPGMNTLSVTAQDTQKRSSLPVTLTVFRDATPPQVTATTPLNNSTLRSAPAAITFTLTDASPLDYGATLNRATVTTTAGANVSGTWSSSGSGTAGTVAFTPAAALGTGQYTATITPTDILANGVTYALTFAIDSTPPAAPGIDPVPAPLNTTSRIITGTRSSDSTSIVVYCAGTAIGTISYPTATTWNVYVSGLREGNNTFSASAVDLAGNTSATTTATLTVDTTPPAVGATPAGGLYKSTQSIVLATNEQTAIYYTMDGSTPTASAAIYSQPLSIQANTTLKYFGKDLAGNSSEIKTENYVIDTAPPLLALSTLNDATATNNEILNIAGMVTDNTGLSGITVNEKPVPVNSDGSFSYALLLTNGANALTTVATDLVGNRSSDTRTITLDQTAPVLTVTAPADNSKTAGILLEVRGTVDEASTVTVKIGDTVQSAIMNGGAFTATITLVPGYNTIEITASDLAGNRSAVKRTVAFDDQSPSLAVTGPSQDIRTNQSNLTITGTVADALTAVGVTISKDNEIYTPPVIDGTFEQAVSLAEEKTYRIVVTARDEVGTAISVQRNVIYDITPPLLSIDPIASPTSRPSLPVGGTREAGTVVTVASSTATVGEVSYPTATTWLAAIAGLREGENVITATSADAAGNAVTATATIVLASRLPEIRIKATPDVIWPPNHQMVPVTITGSVETYGAAIKSISISVRDEYGKIRYDHLTFGSTVMLEAWRRGNDRDGRKYTITVAVTDTGGATTSKTATVTVPHDNSFQPGVSGRWRGMRW